MRALVTGGSGFLGQLLVKKLLDDGFSVRLLSRSVLKITLENLETIVGDLTSEADFSDIAIGCDVIFNCAGEVNHQDKMFALHVEGTRKLIEAVNASFQIDGKSKHWVQLSSVGAYGSSLKPGVQKVVNEQSEPKPIGVYEVTKTLADEMIIESSNNTSMTYTILRPSNIVGVSMPNNSFRELLRAISKRRFFFVGSTKSIATYIHVDDVVDALIICARNKKARNQIFNLSHDCYLSEIVISVCNVFGFKPNFLLLPETPLRFFVWIFSRFFTLPLTKSRIDALISKTTYPYTKIKDILGFTPKKSIPEFAVEYCEYLNVKT
jgi:nucleoside-diphosphate-sugar epimerase